MYVPGFRNRWSRGSCWIEISSTEPSLKSHCQLVGLPPEVSRKTTLNGAGPLNDEGDTSPLPVNAAFGGLPPVVPSLTVMPVLTGKTAEDDTATDPPRMLEMPGVMIPNVQVRATSASSPSAVPVKVGAGAVSTPPTIGRSQLLAVASFLIWFWYRARALTAVASESDHAVGLFAARLAP